MRRTTRWVPTLCLAGALGLGPATAQAHPPVREQAEDLWDGELSLNLPAAMDVSTPAGADKPVSRSASLEPRLAATYYLQPLVDESEGALALLTFYQHPGFLQLSGGADQLFDRAQGDWSQSRRGLALDAAAEFYPWHETGLSASAGASFAGAAGALRSAAEGRYSAGLVRYFRPNLRAELAYVGSTTDETRLVQSPTAPSLEDRLNVSNRGRVAAEAALLEDRLSARVDVELGQYTEDRTAVGLSGASAPGSFAQGLLFRFQAQATAYAGHRLSGTLGGGLQGESATITPDQTKVGASERTVLTPLVLAGLQYFPLDNLWLNLGYQLTLPRTRGTNTPQTDGYGNALAFSLGWRI
jgi:hypothetical protein